MSESDIDNHLAEYARKYPSLITVEQAAEIAVVPVKTIYHWSSIGHLCDCKTRPGKHLLIGRDCFIRFLLGESIQLKRSA